MDNSASWLDDIHSRLLETPCSSIVVELVAKLDAMRISMPSNTWRELAASLRRHPIAALLRHDPYTRRALEKPRGYAGDAVMMDFLYDGMGSAAASCGEVSEVGRAVFQGTAGSRSGDAVRERRERLAQYIDTTATKRELPTIVSLACGHARELDVSRALRTGSRLRWVGIDQDAESLQAVHARLAGRDHSAGVEAVNAGVSAILRGTYAIPRADLIYSSGLFDYLNDRTAVALLSRMLDACKPDGRIVIANFASDSTDRGYMESFMDWWLLYRSEEDFKALADAARPGCAVSTRRDHSGRAIYLEIATIAAGRAARSALQSVPNADAMQLRPRAL